MFHLRFRIGQRRTEWHHACIFLKHSECSITRTVMQHEKLFILWWRKRRDEAKGGRACCSFRLGETESECGVRCSSVWERRRRRRKPARLDPSRPMFFSFSLGRCISWKWGGREPHVPSHHFTLGLQLGPIQYPGNSYPLQAPFTPPVVWVMLPSKAHSALIFRLD